MAEEEIAQTITNVGQFHSVSELIVSSPSIQIAFVVLIVGIIAITTVYRKFSKRVRSQKLNYTRPHVSRFVQVVVLPFFAIALVSSVNFYIQVFELFDEVVVDELSDELNPVATFAKILNTINILVIGYTIAHLIPIALDKYERSKLEYEDFLTWKEKGGFSDDEGDLFHKLFRWVPPTQAPSDLGEEEFQKHLQTEEGRKILERFRTSKGTPIGSYEALVANPFEEWKRSERRKYDKYFQNCISGNNNSGRKLKLGQVPEEIYTALFPNTKSSLTLFD